jgi:hypothetical protein
MKTNIKSKSHCFKTKLPTKKAINEIIDKLVGRNPNILKPGKHGCIKPRDLCRIVTTMYIAGNYP